MYAKLKYIILIFTLTGIGLGIFSFIKIGEYFYQDFYFPSVLVLLLVIFFFLPRNLKMKSKLLNIVALGMGIILFVITLAMTLEYFEMQYRGKILAEYSELNCEQMEHRFSEDIENNKLKYFSFGMFSSEKFDKSLKKIGIENYNLGCWVRDNFLCYNEWVEQYLIEKENIKITELYE